MRSKDVYRAWVERNRDRIHKSQRKYREENRYKINEKQRERHRNNPDKHRKAVVKCRAKSGDYGYKSHLSRKYNISIEEYDRLLELQGGKCAICEYPEVRKRNGKVMRLVVDHDHLDGRIRGLTCHKCNAGIGMFGDCVELLISAAHYLMRDR